MTAPGTCQQALKDALFVGDLGLLESGRTNKVIKVIKIRSMSSGFLVLPPGWLDAAAHHKHNMASAIVSAIGAITSPITPPVYNFRPAPLWRRLVSKIRVGNFRGDSRFHPTPVGWNLGWTREFPTIVGISVFKPDFTLRQLGEIWD